MMKVEVMDIVMTVMTTGTVIIITNIWNILHSFYRLLVLSSLPSTPHPCQGDLLRSVPQTDSMQSLAP